MKIIANRKSLLSALTLASQAVAARPQKEVLSNVLVTADPNRCTLYGTDFDVVVKSAFFAEVDSPGSVLAPVKLLHCMLRELPDESVLLSTDKQILSVRGASSKHDIPTAKANEFPALPSPKWTAEVMVSMESLANCLKAVVRQADDTEKRYTLNCVRFEIGRGKLCLVATDGKAIGVAEIKLESGAEAAAMVPHRACRLIQGLEIEEPAKLRIEQNWMSIEAGSFYIMARLLEGPFVRWRDGIPASLRNSFSTSVSPSCLASFIRRTCFASPSPLDDHKASLNVTGGDLILRSSVEGSQSESRMPCVAEGELKATVRWNYLLDILGGFGLFGDEPVLIECAEEGKALKLSRDHLTYAVAQV